MDVVALGDGAFVAAFRLSGIRGMVVEAPDEAEHRIMELANRRDIGLILVSDKIAKPIRDKINVIKSEKAVPLIYEVPSPGSRFEKIEYRNMLKQILGV